MATPEQVALFRKQTKALLTPEETKDVKEALGEFLEDKARVRVHPLISVLIVCCASLVVCDVSLTRLFKECSFSHLCRHCH